MLARALLLTTVVLAVPDAADAAARLGLTIETDRGRKVLVMTDDDKRDGDGVELVFHQRRGGFSMILDDPEDRIGGRPDGCAGDLEVFCSEAFLDSLDRIDIRLGDGRDVVQNAQLPVRFVITGGAGPDRLEGGALDDVIDVGEGGGVITDAAFGGDGEDRLIQTILPFPARTLLTRVAMHGGPGDDELVPSSLVVDRDGVDGFFDGGEGDDEITGTRGEDDIDGGAGNDRIVAGASDDRIDPGTGEDRVDASSGDDTILQPPDPLAAVFRVTTDGTDVLNGGTGRDTVDYSGRLMPLELFPNDTLANDGAEGERDQMLGIERVVGGKHTDTFFGFARLDDDIPDDFTGGESQDTLLGGDGDDRLDGGFGADTLRGGTDDDRLLAREGQADRVIACDSGEDSAEIDLTDPEPTGCERVDRRAANEPPGVEIRGPRTLRRRAGRLHVPLRCPTAARAGCRGTLTVLTTGRARSTSYRVRRGARTVAHLPAPAPGAGTLRATQRGIKGARTSTVQVRVR